MNPLASRIAIALLATVAGMAQSASAQTYGNAIGLTFFASELSTKPGLVKIDPKAHVVFTFPDETRTFFSRDNSVKVALSGDDAIVYLTSNVAKASISIQAGEAWYLFELSAVQGIGVRRVQVIKDEDSRSLSPEATPGGGTPGATKPGATPSNTSVSPSNPAASLWVISAVGGTGSIIDLKRHNYTHWVFAFPP